MQDIEKRKLEHIEIALGNNIDGVELAKFNQFDPVRFKYFALPEMDFSKVDISCEFLGKRLAAPLMITAITGGVADAQKINSDLAAACEEGRIMFGLGSMRPMLESENLSSTYCVRKVAPSAFVCGNIGAFQLKRYGVKKIETAIKTMGANALCVHLNPLQELLQPDGDRDWNGVLDAISRLCKETSIPIIAKEVGFGVNLEVALELQDAGVCAIDLAGKGGSNWALIEMRRGKEKIDPENPAFLIENPLVDLGQFTIEGLAFAKDLKVPVIASGGIRNGVDAAKCLAMGAKICGAALPFLKAQQKGGKSEVVKLIEKWKFELSASMFLTRSNNLAELTEDKLIFGQ